MKAPALKDDPNVKMPAAVRATIEASKALFDNQQGVDGQTYAEHQEANGVTPQGSEGEPPRGEQGFNAPAEQAGQAHPPVQQPAPKAQQPAPQAQQPAPEGDESWEHKYKSAHGRNLRAQEQIKSLSDEIRSLQQVVASMQQPSFEDMPPISTERLLTPEEVTDYGEDFLAVVGKKAREDLAPLFKAQRDEIARLQAQVNGVTHGQKMTAMDHLYDQLHQQLPEWEQINTNPAFGQWLALPDPFSGAIRKDMLNAAYSQGNANRVLAFFNGFLADEAALAPARAEPGIGTQVVQRTPLSNFAAPGRAKVAASPPGPEEKPIITRAQIANFYSMVAAGKYRADEVEKKRLEEMIYEAQREGRIR